MQRREKLLLVLFVAAIALWQGAPMAYRTFYGPIEARRSTRDALRIAVDERQLTKRAGDVARFRLEQSRAISLPPDEHDAQRLYQNWLTDLSLLAGFRDVKVSPERRILLGSTGTAVQVRVDGNATLAELAGFLDHFHRSALLHRIVQISTESPSNQGDPRLRVSLVAEGLAMKDAPPRERLFPEVELAADLPAKATVLSLPAAEGFPKEGGFRVRIGGEFATVARIDGDSWTIVRGVDGTIAAAHPAGERLELAPVHPDVDPPRKPLVVRNPFAKPTPEKPYSPRIASISPQTAIRGAPWKVQVRVDNFDAARGAATFRLVAPPEGMEIDETTGEVTWTAGEGVRAGLHRVQVTVAQPDALPQPVSQSFSITLNEANLPPRIAAVTRKSVIQGQTLAFRPVATDDGPAGSLTWELAEGSPPGAEIDSKTGEVRWRPADTVEAGDYTIVLKVTDRGSPAMSATQKVAVGVAEDDAAFTYLVAAVVRDEAAEAWLYDRANNRRMVLSQGSRFQVSDISARVKEIRRDAIVIESGRDVWKLALGENLRSLRPPTVLPPLASATTVPVGDEPAEAEIPSDAAEAEVPAKAESDESRRRLSNGRKMLSSREFSRGMGV